MTIKKITEGGAACTQSTSQAYAATSSSSGEAPLWRARLVPPPQWLELEAVIAQDHHQRA